MAARRNRTRRKNKRKKRNKKLNSESLGAQLSPQPKRVRKLETASTDPKTPRPGANADGYMQKKMRFSIFEHADRDGKWSWGQGRDWCQEYESCGDCPNHSKLQKDCCKISALMQEMEKLTWSEILKQETGSKKRRDKHHHQKLEDICPEAQQRWHELDRDETMLFRFRTSSKGRIWGFRQVETFYVVWWDPDHNIFPAKKTWELYI